MPRDIYKYPVPKKSLAVFSWRVLGVNVGGGNACGNGFTSGMQYLGE